MDKRIRKGYSLVEMMIAMAITAIVITGLIALLSYGSRNMRITQTMTALQNQAKDASNHLSSYVMEASKTEWDDDKKVLIITKQSAVQEIDAEGNYPTPTVERWYYWMKKNANGVGAIYFAKEDKVVNPTDPTKVNLVAKKDFLLTDKVKDFECKSIENKKARLQISIKFQDKDAKFTCNKDIYLRNQANVQKTEEPEGGA